MCITERRGGGKRRNESKIGLSRPREADRLRVYRIPYRILAATDRVESDSDMNTNTAELYIIATAEVRFLQLRPIKILRRSTRKRHLALQKAIRDPVDDPHANRSMEPPSKRICIAADDRLSDLPDCLIHTILSFLESRQVVRSSVLSRRWRNLWRSVPCIDIDQTLFRRGDRCPGGECCKGKYGKRKVCKKEWRPFEEFSNNLLLLNNATSLDKLRIHVPHLDSDDTQAIEACLRWILSGFQCNPAVIDIHMDFSCRELGFLPGLGSCSSRLTKLFLHRVKLGVIFAEQLHSGCPVLEELSLVTCACHFDEIMSRRLRYLRFDDCLHFTQKGRMVVTAPKLTSLRISISTILCPNGISVTDTTSCVRASLHVTDFWKIEANFWDKLRNIFNVMHLELVGDTMKEIQWMSDELPKFQNMRTLLINRCNLKTSASIQALDRLLQSAPGLKKLTLQNCEFTGHSKRRTARAKWRHVALQSQNLTSFKCDNLEVIEIKHRKDDDVDDLFELIMGLWRNLGKTNIKLTKV